MIGGCASDAPYEPATYVVRPQDTLYSIAWRHNLDYRTLAKWNNIGADYRVSVGQVLVLEPSGEPRAPPASRPPGSGVRTQRAGSVPSVGKPVPLADPPAAAAAPSGSQRAGGAGQSTGALNGTATKAPPPLVPGSAPHGPDPVAAPAEASHSLDTATATDREWSRGEIARPCSYRKARCRPSCGCHRARSGQRRQSQRGRPDRRAAGHRLRLRSSWSR